MIICLLTPFFFLLHASYQNESTSISLTTIIGINSTITTTTTTTVTIAQTSFTTLIDSTTPENLNPISIRSVRWLGYQTANNSCSHRDLGFTGKLSGKWYAVYGDTLWAAPGVTNMFNDTPGFHGIVRDSVSLMTEDPLTVVDLHLNGDEPVKHQLQFVPYFEGWGETNRYGFGGTSICEVDEGIETGTGTGAVYYLVVSGLTLP